MREKLKFVIASALPLIILNIPTEFIPIQGLSIVEHRLIAIFVMALLFWVLEPVPVFATSVFVIFLELIMISDKSFVLFKEAAGTVNFGVVLSYKEIMATFASPIILLFLGGFFLAMAATKYQLDINLARVFLKPFGTKPAFVLLGLMIVTAVFSMFMSNTATTAMMLAIISPVLALFEKGDRGRVAFALGIPFAANIGGIGTPIGTPPNIIAMKYLTGESVISFGTWMCFSVPLVLILLTFAWLLLLVLHKPQTPSINVAIKGKFRKNWQSLIVYVTFTLTILLWLFDFLHGMNSYIVAMIPVTVFSMTKIITTQDLKRINWDVLWLVSGGIALGMGLEKSGLVGHLIESIPFASFHPLFILFLATIITIIMATFMSNTATANLLIPIMAVLATSLPGMAQYGGTRLVVLAVGFACSLAMALPVSTPPNAMAHASGYIETSEMMKAGTIISGVGILGVYTMLFVLKQVGFF